MTADSPLGIRAIKQQLANPLVSSPCIKQWFNAYNDRDVVAFSPLTARTLNGTPPIENKGDVFSFTDNRYSIEGYLTDLVVARQIVQWL